MKAGANATDVIVMKNLAAAGEDAQAISAKMGIALSCVESHLAKPKPKPKRKRRTAAQMAADKEKDDETSTSAEEKGPGDESGTEEDEQQT